jgi:hypothetical protein
MTEAASGIATNALGANLFGSVTCGMDKLEKVALITY